MAGRFNTLSREIRRWLADGTVESSSPHRAMRDVTYAATEVRAFIGAMKQSNVC